MYTLQFGTYTFPNISFELEGLPHDNRIEEGEVLQAHGSVIQTAYLESRKFKIKGVIYQDVAEDAHTDLLNMQNALLSQERAFKYRSDRYINCYTRSIESDLVQGTDQKVIEVGIDLVARIPFHYSDGVSYTVVQNVNGGTTTFNVNNLGNAFSEPRVMFYASGLTVNDAIAITNLSDQSRQERFRGVVAFGKTLDMNTENYSVLNNLVDALTLFEGNFLNLVAGSNTLQYVGATGRLTVEYKYRWY